MVFESILISLVNKEQNIILICFSIKQKYILIFTIVYICFIFGNIFLIMIPPCYAYLYYKWLSKNLAVSDEVVFKWENRHCTTTLKNIFGENFIINKNNGLIVIIIIRIILSMLKMKKRLIWLLLIIERQ